MYFEVFVPGTRSGMDVTLQVEANSWRQALRVGLEHNQITMGNWESFFIELGEDQYSITDAAQRKEYKVRSIEQIHGSNVVKATDPRPTSSSERPVSTPKSSESNALSYTERSTGRFRQISTTNLTTQAEQDGRVVQEKRFPTGKQKAVELDKQQDIKEQHDDTAELGGVSDTALEDVFLELPTIMEPGYLMNDAIDFVIDIAMRYIPCLYGGVLFASDVGDSLYFAAVRGHKTDNLLDIDLPINKGHASFALRSGICITVTDAKNDNRYDPTIAKNSNIQEETILCAPIQHGERAFGVLILINRQKRNNFTQYDSNIVSYIASQMGLFIQRQIDAQPLK